MKVLVTGLDDTTVTFLRDHGIAVEKEDLEGVEDLESWLRDGLFDGGVLDLEKSGLGIYAARGLRVQKIATPIIGISRGSDDRKWSDHRAMFLENGGDDLLKGPVNPREVVASLRAVTRRFKGALLDVAEYETGNAKLKVNLTTRTVKLNDLDIGFTGRELSMMLLFASSPGRILSKETILTQMYAGTVDDEPEMKIIDVFVCKIRRKLSEMHPDAGKFIETVWGQGYRLPQHMELSRKVA